MFGKLKNKYFAREGGQSTKVANFEKFSDRQFRLDETLIFVNPMYLRLHTFSQDLLGGSWGPLGTVLGPRRPENHWKTEGFLNISGISMSKTYEKHCILQGLGALGVKNP